MTWSPGAIIVALIGTAVIYGVVRLVKLVRYSGDK